ncbi:ATP-dependent nuclease [Carboxylicivirga marina]|uniref:ATP-dependent nuclease n=1 Tax=Carboxylicivirga marina TaxID=2800988 RepID=UPI00259722A4|nr:AAA family ATPase [uncultured Carboxylicivirga sp.]
MLEFSIKNYRSVSNLKLIPSKDDNLSIICGSNNVGKTNFLRALQLFFNPTTKNFNSKDDIPFHIEEGSRGQGYATTLKAKIWDIENNEIYIITEKFSEKKEVVSIDLSGKKGTEILTDKDVLEFLTKNFKFFFIEASNVNIPELVSEIVNEEILPIGLDKRRKSQKESLERLEDFIEKSKEAVGRIENDLTKIFKEILNEVNTIDSNEWKLKINFPEYVYLREAISSMINFTLFDTNERKLETKGSGIQRTILLSLIQYVNSKTKREVIWAIDEPEAFLQADLQKSLFNKLKYEASENQIFITTHSNFFIDLNNLENTFLFAGTKEVKEYSRKPDMVFYKLNTIILDGSDYVKAMKIKEHFGLKRNDSWEIFPFNIVVEGQEDKDLLVVLFEKFNITVPNILVVGGVDKYKGYLQFINDMCSDMPIKPKLLVLFDKDGGGRSQYESLKNKSYKYFDTECRYIIRFDGQEYNNIELEDFAYPDIVFNAANKFLRKKGYKSIKKLDRAKRTKPTHDKKPILEFLTELSSFNNEDKTPIDFESMGAKLFLSKKICEEVRSTEIKEHDSLYPEVKRFLLEITSG